MPGSPSSPDVAGERCLHLIGEDGALVGKDVLNGFLETSLGRSKKKGPTQALGSNVKQCGTKYHVVGVFGGQSSGKSTLLNHLFATSFETMEEDTGRHQTTKGAFLAKYQHPTTNAADDASASADSSEEDKASSSALFVMDFEGTDGMERGEDQSFERQLSLFALSVADVLVINMWSNDVGRYNAANMSLLRTIFEVNLQLFTHEAYLKEEKPTLLIVLRDFTESDLQKYADIVSKSLNKIWESITKPTGFETSEITSLFHVRFQGLPHFKLQREAFDAEVRSFRRWFLDPLSPKYLFDSTVSYRHIPLEALPGYFDSCWASIQQSRDLDIPTQRDLVAEHRCTELLAHAMETFGTLTESRASRIKAGDLQPQLEASLHQAADAIAAEYAGHTKLYARKVVAAYSTKLSTALSCGIDALLALQTTRLVDECMRNTEDEVQAVVDDAFKQLYTTKGLLDGTASSSDAHQLVKNFWSNIANGVRELEDRLASGANVAAFGRYQQLVTEDNAALERATAQVLDCIVERVRRRIAAMASDACSTMTKGFDYVLTHKDDGTARIFMTTSGLQNAFPAARLAGLVVLGCIFYCRLKPYGASLQRTKSMLGESKDEKRFYLSIPSFKDGDISVHYPDLTGAAAASAESDGDDTSSSCPSEADDSVNAGSVDFTAIDPADILMNKAAVRRAFDLYSQQIQFSMQMQLRTIESSQQNIPMWVWVALLVLGHNEFYYVATSPVLLLFVLIVGYVFFSAWLMAQWQRFQETGPQGVVLVLKGVACAVEPHWRAVRGAVAPLLNTQQAEPAASAASSDQPHSVPKEAAAKKQD